MLTSKYGPTNILGNELTNQINILQNASMANEHSMK